MAETLPGHSFTLKQLAPFVRTFFFGTAATTVSVSISKNGGTFNPAAGAVAEIANGWYSVTYTAVDTNTGGILAAHATGLAGGPADFADLVQAQIFTDLALNANGQVLIASSIKQNQPCNGFMFVMTDSATHAPKTGLTVTAQRNLAGAGFAPCANPVSELSNGTYLINLAASDTNANSVMYRFTAAAADDLDILILTQP